MTDDSKNTQEKLFSFIGGRSDLPRRGYSLFVRTMKWGLPLAALVIVGILIARLQESAKPLPVIAGAPTITPEGQVALVGARYEGVDEKHRPFRVTADEASHALSAKDGVTLKKPMADILLDDNSWLAASADEGEFTRDSARLRLSGNVRIFYDAGYEASLDDIDIDLKKSEAQSQNPVRAQGPTGTLTAQKITVADGGANDAFVRVEKIDCQRHFRRTRQAYAVFRSL